MDGGDGNEDPLKRSYDFFSLWVETDYSRELAEYTELAEESPSRSILANLMIKSALGSSKN